MLKQLVILALLGTAAAPIAAQAPPDVTKRVDRIERELRAVQRKVFPDGTPLVPEIGGPGALPTPALTAGSNAGVTDLISRVDGLEGQIRSLTGQVEQNGYKLRQLEEQVKRLTDASVAAPPVLSTPTGRPAPARPSAATPPPAMTGADVERPATGDEADDAYTFGFRLWQAKQYGPAQTELKKVAEQFPNHRVASRAQNLLGRAYLDEGNAGAAAIALYESYQKWPNGDRAAESLYWLGESLVQLKRPVDACKAFAEFGAVYGATAPEPLKAQVTAGRRKAKC